MAQNVPWLSFWYTALSSPYGIELVCSDFDAVRAKLYKERAEAKDTDLESIALCQSPFDPTRLWMVKRQ